MVDESIATKGASMPPDDAAEVVLEVGVMRSSPALAIVSLRAAKSRRPALAALAIVTGILATMLTMMAPAAAFARQRRSHPAATKPAQPDQNSEPYAAALLMEPETGTVMFENNALVGLFDALDPILKLGP